MLKYPIVTLLGVVGQHRAEFYRQDAKDAKKLQEILALSAPLR
jgi:hypothetical protein